MNRLFINGVLGQSYIKVKDKTIDLPSRLRQVLILGNKVLISFGGEIIPDEILNSKALLFKHREELNRNIWCLDFNGNLLWKIPSSYTSEQHQANIEREGLPLPVAYQAAYPDPDSEENIIANNGYADFVFVNLASGSIIKKEKRGK